MVLKVRLCDQSPKSHLIISHIANTVERSKKCIIITGAGISCNAAIADFHSTDGLYKFIERKYPDFFVEGKDFFNSIFQDEISASIFYSFVTELQSLILSTKPVNTCKFIKILRDRSSILRCYTQNMDNLDTQEGVCVKTRDIKNNAFRLYDNTHKLKCVFCGVKYDYNEGQIKFLKNGLKLNCPACMNRSGKKINEKKRLSKAEYSHPDIVLYDKTHPISDFLSHITTSDIKKRPDLLLIIGISFRIIGIKTLVKDISEIVHSNGGKVILVNRTEPSNNEWKNIIDWYVEADCDEWVEDLRKKNSSMFMHQSKLSAIPIKKKTQHLEKHLRDNKKNKLFMHNVSRPVSPSAPILKRTYNNYEKRSSQGKTISNTCRINFSIPPPKMAPLVVTKDKIHVVCRSPKQKIKL
ncbi:hypothetical protein PCANB_000929 [Pneumocystis canis]|nr:hypothetical protein PCANB_000929 [Pneumocystis canis]